MSFFNDAQRGGHSVDLEHYGMENDEEYDALYPTRDQICDD